MCILLTDGLGFIGSHTVIEPIRDKHKVIIADNLINSNIEVLDRLRQINNVKPTFYQIGVTDKGRFRRSSMTIKIMM